MKSFYCRKCVFVTLLSFGLAFASACGNNERAEVVDGQKPDVRYTYLKGYSGKVFYINIKGTAYFEGDIILGSTEKMERIKTEVELGSTEEMERTKTGVERLASKNSQPYGVTYSVVTKLKAIPGRPWTNNTIPYRIANGFPNQQRITGAIQHIHDNTNLRLVAQTNEDNFVTFRHLDDDGNDGGCSSYIGMQGDEQFITLGTGCTEGIAIHEIGHAAGLWHEHSRSDRDDFITIHWDNIEMASEEEKKINFQKHDEEGDTAMDFGSYDCGSIMHYGETAFGKTDADGNMLKTITIKSCPGGITSIGQIEELSAGDIAGLNYLYPILPAAPVLSNGNVSNITATSADFRVTSDHDATAHWVVRLTSEPAPSAAEIIAGAGANTGAMTANTAFSRTLSGLSSRKTYRLYFVASNNGATSDVWSQTFTTLPLPIVDVPTGVDGRILSPAQTGDTVSWVEIARNGNYALVVRSEFINVYPSSKAVWGDPAWQHTNFGSTSSYMTAQNSVRGKINAWFNGTAQGEAEKLPANARLRDFSVQLNVSQAMGTSSWPASVNDGFSKPTRTLLGTGDDIAFALSYGEAANFVSLLHFLRGVYIANEPSSAVAVANYAKISIPTSYAYYGMWLRSPGDLPNTVGFLSNNFSQVVPGRVFQEYLNGRGLIYPALWVDEDIF